MTQNDLLSRDLISDNVEALRKIFPSCVSEALNSDDTVSWHVDFDLLRQELSGSVVDGPRERFHLDWPGKRQAILGANSRIASTLRPCKAESVQFDNTRNIFIEGDNLDALKLLQETYLSRIRMIYIDPPYNTGNDFIYNDDFCEGASDYLQRSLQLDEDRRRLVAHKESNGRFHSEWLSMMYARLKLARNLLADDGVIFISIDDCEVHNLRLICDEIFGISNFYCTFVWQRRSGAMDSVDNVSADHEYVLCYGRQKNKLHGIARTYERYKNPDNDPRGPWIADNLSAGKAGGDVHYAIVDPETGSEYFPPQGRYWPYNRQTMQRKIAEGRIIFPKSPAGRPMLKRFQSEARSEVLPVSTWMRSDTETKSTSNALLSALNTSGTKELQKILGGKYFSHPKSTVLIRSLASQVLSDDGDIVLDFFAGSATTAQAIMELSAETGKHYRFIAIQIPELCDAASEAYKAGYRDITDIAKARMRKVGERLASSNSRLACEFDIGFRTLRVDSSNMKDILTTRDAIKQSDLLDQVENIKEGRTPEDLLFQVLLDFGVDLSSPIEQVALEGKTVFYVDNNALAACFDQGVCESLVREIAKRQPLRAVFRDSGYDDDSARINVAQVFKALSPHTEVRGV